MISNKNHRHDLKSWKEQEEKEISNLVKRTIISIIVVILFLIFGLLQMNAQATKYSPNGSVSISLHQDGRLAFLGDDKGNDAFTLNFLARVKLEGNQDEYGYLVIFPEYEYADLKGGKYVRYSANIGYVLNQMINNVEASLGFGYGWVDRQGTTSSMGLNSELAYKLTDRLKISLIGQYVERKDIEDWKYSTFFGLEYNL